MAKSENKFQGLVLVAKPSADNVKYYSVCKDGKQAYDPATGRKLVGFPSKATAGNIVLVAPEDKTDESFRNQKLFG